MTLDVPLEKPYALGATGIVTLTRTDRLSLGAMFRPLATALTAGSGTLVGPTGTNGELTLLTDVLLRVAPFIAAVQGTHSTQQGQYIVPNPTQRDIAVPAKDAALFRKALVVVRVADSIEAGVASSAATDGAWLEILPGALAASNPALPSMAAYANYLLLGELSIPSTASGLPVTITKYEPRAILRGQVWPVTDEAARLAIPAADRYPGLEVLALSTGRVWLYNGAKWNLVGGPIPHCILRRAAGTMTYPTSTWGAFPFDNIETAQTIDTAMWSAANPTRITATVDGIYLADAVMTINEGHGATSFFTAINTVIGGVSALRRGRPGIRKNVSDPGEFGATGRVKLAVGDYVESMYFNASGAQIGSAFAEASPRFELTWLGNY